MKFRVGDLVAKNPGHWQKSNFDSWGRGIGIGVVVEPPFELDDDEVDVRWPAGRCFEDTKGLIRVESKEEFDRPIKQKVSLEYVRIALGALRDLEGRISREEISNTDFHQDIRAVYYSLNVAWNMRFFEESDGIKLEQIEQDEWLRISAFPKGDMD